MCGEIRRIVQPGVPEALMSEFFMITTVQPDAENRLPDAENQLPNLVQSSSVVVFPSSVVGGTKFGSWFYTLERCF